MVLTAEQREIGAAVRDFLDHQAPLGDRRVEGAAGVGALWQRMDDRLGLAGMVVPADRGGLGLGTAELAVVAEQLGRVLVPSPLTGLVATSATSSPGWPAMDRDGLQRVRTGSPLGVIALRSGSAWTLSGSVPAVTGAALVGVVSVVAQTGTGPRLFLVPSDAHGVTMTPLVTLDLTEPGARLEISDAVATAVDEDGPPLDLHRLADLATLLLAAEQLGGIGWCLGTATDYAKVRYQFGRPIGSFQAVKHACADMYVSWELATTAVRHAAWTADHAPARLATAASLAKSTTSRAFMAAARATIQVLGGLGFTWEHDAHLYYRRAVSTLELLGGPAWHEERLLAASAVAVPGAAVHAL